MFEELMKAIDKSIEKWKSILYAAGHDNGTEDCACCQYAREKAPAGGYTTNCTKCPVLLYAGMRDGVVYDRSAAGGCGVTPWIDSPQWVDDKEDQDKANAELTFLYEVRRACIVTRGTFNVPTE